MINEYKKLNKEQQEYVYDVLNTVGKDAEKAPEFIRHAVVQGSLDNYAEGVEGVDNVIALYLMGLQNNFRKSKDAYGQLIALLKEIGQLNTGA